AVLLRRALGARDLHPGLQRRQHAAARLGRGGWRRRRGHDGQRERLLRAADAPGRRADHAEPAQRVVLPRQRGGAAADAPGGVMDPAVLAWALAQPPGSRAAALAAAYTGGTTRVSFEGRTVEYRSLDELGRALAMLRGAENSAARRPSVTLASFSRERTG